MPVLDLINMIVVRARRCRRSAPIRRTPAGRSRATTCRRTPNAAATRCAASKFDRVALPVPEAQRVGLESLMFGRSPASSPSRVLRSARPPQVCCSQSDPLSLRDTTRMENCDRLPQARSAVMGDSCGLRITLLSFVSDSSDSYGVSLGAYSSSTSTAAVAINCSREITWLQPGGSRTKRARATVESKCPVASGRVGRGECTWSTLMGSCTR